MQLIIAVTIAIEQTRSHRLSTSRSFLHEVDETVIRLLVGLGGFIQNFEDLAIIYSINPLLWMAR